jgi:hypothetical protein
MNKLHDIPGVHYTFHPLPAAASGANTAYEAVCPNPFDEPAYVESIDIIPIEAITGDNTNTQNYNADLVGGTEIANKDFPTGTNGVAGTPTAMTITGTTAQRTIAANGCILIEREEVGTAPARAFGTVARVGWKGA